MIFYEIFTLRCRKVDFVASVSLLVSPVGVAVDTHIILYRGDSSFQRKGQGARNSVGIELLHRPARLHRRAELIPWNLFLGSLNV